MKSTNLINRLFLDRPGDLYLTMKQPLIQFQGVDGRVLIGADDIISVSEEPEREYQGRHQHAVPHRGVVFLKVRGYPDTTAHIIEPYPAVRGKIQDALHCPVFAAFTPPPPPPPPPLDPTPPSEETDHE